MAVCTIGTCRNKLRSRGMCSTHWKRDKKFGSPVPMCACGEPSATNMGSKKPTGRCHRCEAIYVMETSIVITADGCWEWAKARTSAGYGMTCYRNDLTYAHRLSYLLRVGPISGDAYVCHVCDNPPCINPGHLFIGTPSDNVQDMMSKGRHRTQHIVGA